MYEDESELNAKRAQLITCYVRRVSLAECVDFSCNVFTTNNNYQGPAIPGHCMESFFRKEGTSIDEPLDYTRTMLDQCRLCGVFLSPRYIDEFEIHLRKCHPRQFLCWVDELHNIYARSVRHVRQSEHPVWSHFRRVSRRRALCLTCLHWVKSASCSNLLKHCEIYHSQVARKVRLEWKVQRKDIRRCNSPEDTPVIVKDANENVEKIQDSSHQNLCSCKCQKNELST